MAQRYDLYGFPVTVTFEPGLVGIHNGHSLRMAVNSHPERAVALLVEVIKTDYDAKLGRGIAIGDDSFVVEIWGHLYFEYFLLKYSKLLRLILFFGLYKRLRKSCVIIDCGERGKDPNRRLWDYLARYRKRLSGWVSRIELRTDDQSQ